MITHSVTFGDPCGQVSDGTIEVRMKLDYVHPENDLAFGPDGPFFIFPMKYDPRFKDGDQDRMPQDIIDAATAELAKQGLDEYTVYHGGVKMDTRTMVVIPKDLGDKVPNSIDDYLGFVQTVFRVPVNRDRKRKKTDSEPSSSDDEPRIHYTEADDDSSIDGDFMGAHDSDDGDGESDDNKHGSNCTTCCISSDEE